LDRDFRRVLGCGPKDSRARYDNAVAESFFSSLKKERIKKQIYKNRQLAIADLSDHIDMFYNRTRRHSHLGGLSPEQFEAAHKRPRKGLH
jgi:putative transposase